MTTNKQTAKEIKKEFFKKLHNPIEYGGFGVGTNELGYDLIWIWIKYRLKQQEQDTIKKCIEVVGVDEKVENVMDVKNGYVKIDMDETVRNELRQELRTKLKQLLKE